MADLDNLIHRIAVGRSNDGQLNLLRLIENTGEGATGSTLVEAHDVGRPAVYSGLDVLEDAGFLLDSDGGGFEATRTGRKAAAVYREVAQRTTDETLAYLARSHNRRELIRMLEEGPQRKSELAAGADAPSRSTVQRILREFEERSWAERTSDGRVKITDSTVRLLDEYRWLRDCLEQAVEKGPCIEQLADWADVPLQMLEETELVVATEEKPHALLSAAIDAASLREGSLDSVRTIVPLFDLVVYDVFGQHVDSDTTHDVVFSRTAYEQLTEPGNIHYLAGAILAPTVEIRIHPDPLYTGLGIYDDAVLLGGSVRHDLDAAVTGTSDAFHEWAVERFDELKAESEKPSERLRRWVGRAAPRIAE